MDEHQLTYTGSLRDEGARLGRRFLQRGECSCGRKFEARSSVGVQRARRNVQVEHHRHQMEQDGQRPA